MAAAEVWKFAAEFELPTWPHVRAPDLDARERIRYPVVIAGGERIRNVDIVGGDHYLTGRPDLQMRVADEIAAFAEAL